jgi:transcription elongation factor GreB
VDETVAQRGWISVDSPLAKALLGRAVGEEITVALPGGKRRYRILAIDYAE